MGFIVADTSFLIYLATTPSPLYSMLEERIGMTKLVVPSLVVREMWGLSKKQGKRGMGARAALKLLSSADVVEVEGADSVDEALLLYAKLNRLPVATLDEELAHKLRAAGVTVIRPRGDELFVNGPLH